MGTLNQLTTAGGAEHIPSVSLGYEIDFHAELWSPDLNSLVADISGDLVTGGSTIHYNGDEPVRHTADLRWGTGHQYDPAAPTKPDWNSHRIKLLCSMTNMKDRERRTYSLGYYFAETTSVVLDAGLDPPVTTRCYDLTAQLDTAIGWTIAFTDGTQLSTAIRDLLEAQAEWGRYEPAATDQPITLGYRLSPTEATLARNRVWAIDDSNTWRRVLNLLAEEGGYRVPWIDRDGVLVVDGQYGTHTTVTLPTAEFTVLGEGARHTTNMLDAPNQWVGIGLVAGTDTTIIVSAQDIERAKGAHSFESRGRRIVRRVYQVDATEEDDTLAAENEAFQRNLARMVASDREVTETVELKMSPMPVFWHSDIVELTDVGLPGKWRVVRWSLPLDGSDMTITATKVGEA